MSDLPTKCEAPYHIGPPTEGLGEGTWWLRDPEWLYWCPNCVGRDFVWLFRFFQQKLDAGLPKEEVSKRAHDWVCKQMKREQQNGKRD